MSESRTGKRFPLRLPITVHAEGAGPTSAMETSNLSSNGVLIHADMGLEIGSQIEFDITLPAEVVGGEQDVAVHCVGRVVRLEQEEGEGGGRQNGVGCVIDEYEFIRKGHAAC